MNDGEDDDACYDMQDGAAGAAAVEDGAAEDDDDEGDADDGADDEVSRSMSVRVRRIMMQSMVSMTTRMPALWLRLRMIRTATSTWMVMVAMVSMMLMAVH